ncbi:MAG TPA: hypothetical protein VK766_10765 [Cytophagaceae bacterium]|jgi:tetratricopeptide (TPR) repeat protein|nr:hypothetical protein [Cytophagaceae bacterium]
MKRLEDKIHVEIEKICDRGDEFAQLGDYPSALENYWKAYDLLPEPKEEWVAGTWILAAIGDTNFLNKDYQAGIDNISTAAKYFPNVADNPFLHLRLGQCEFELGNYEKASDEFMKTFSLEGEELFLNEDSKYFELLKSKLVLEEEETSY